MRTALILLLTLTLYGCPKDKDRVLENPSLESLVGTWESSGFNDYVPYAIVEILPSGVGSVVLANDETVLKFGVLSDFEFGRYDIEFFLTTLEDVGTLDKGKGTVNVSIVQGQLCINELDGERIGEGRAQWCFTKSEKLIHYQEKSKKLLSSGENE